uniref:Uncharacterized protein n=1 Tax=Latimeria chalumnae TaxID=7897 RepID=H3AJC5_LATCH
NPVRRDYTFYSTRHALYSRIDLFLISNSLIHTPRHCMIKTMTILDHVPVELVVGLEPPKLKFQTWRLNTSVLQNKQFCASLQQHLSMFLELNKNSEARRESKWEACKAFIRGHAISFAPFQKKARKKETESLEKDIKELEMMHVATQSPETLNKLVAKKYALNTLYTAQAEYALFYTRCLYYEQGKKGSRLLAYWIKQQETERAIPGVNNQHQQLVSNPEDINGAFTTFYHLGDLKLPRLTPQEAAELDNPITLVEVQSAIQSLKPNKLP